MSIKSSMKAPVLRSIVHFGRLRQSLSARKAVDLARVESVLLLQLGGIGDVLLAFPLLEALLQGLPGRRIMTLTEHGDWLFELFPGEPDSMQHHVLDMSAGYRDKLRRLAAIRRSGVDLVICVGRGDGIVESSVLSALCGAPQRVGFQCEGSPMLYSHSQPFSVEQPLWRQNQQLLQLLGLDSKPMISQLKLSASVQQNARERLRVLVGDHRPLVLLHPWAGNFAHLKTWPMEYFAQLAQRLVREEHAVIGILGGKSDHAAGEALRQLAQSPDCANLCGECSFAETAALIQQSQLLVGNDSSLLHVASGVGTPSVGIFGSTSAEQLLHPDGGCRVVKIDVDCGPCYLHQPWATHRCDHAVKCLKGIAVEQVHAAAREILALPGEHRSA